MNFILINDDLEIPKYKQIVHSIEQAIQKKQVKKGDPLPSINKIRSRYKLSRDTVLLAYNELKTRGIVHSITGKGYYVKNENIDIKEKIFLLFDELNSFKETVYNSFLKALDAESAQVDIFFHHFNLDVFKKLVFDNNGGYTHYIIMPANFDSEDVVNTLSVLPDKAIYILDHTNQRFHIFASVYQDFFGGIQSELTKVLHLLKQYKRIYLIDSYQKQPIEMIEGFANFCIEQKLDYNIVQSVEDRILKTGDIYIVPEEKSLIYLIKKAKKQNLELAKQIGIIAYNETPLKEVVGEGITTISTNFREMGIQLAKMINKKERGNIEIKTSLILRNSV